MQTHWPRRVNPHSITTSALAPVQERFRLRRFSWSAAVFDEAHRLKRTNSATRQAADLLDVGWKLLLTGGSGAGAGGGTGSGDADL